RVHTDGAAASSARALSAEAYTVGNHLVFGQERYQPATAHGRSLIAHELTHVLQQRAGASTVPVQRVATTAADYRIEGIHPLTATRMPNRLLFNQGEDTLGPTEQAKLAAFAATPAPGRLHLHGFASEEGLRSFNAALIDRRIAE